MGLSAQGECAATLMTFSAALFSSAVQRVAVQFAVLPFGSTHSCRTQMSERSTKISPHREPIVCCGSGANSYGLLSSSPEYS